MCDRILKRLFRVVHWVFHVKSVIQSHVLPNRFYIDTDYIVNSLWLILTVLFWSQNVTNLVLCTHDDFAALELMYVHTGTEKPTEKAHWSKQTKPNQTEANSCRASIALLYHAAKPIYIIWRKTKLYRIVCCVLLHAKTKTERTNHKITM